MTANDDYDDVLLPDLIAIDTKGNWWRVWHGEPEFWSMVPTNPDNSPIPQPVRYYTLSPAAAAPIPELCPDCNGTGLTTGRGAYTFLTATRCTHPNAPTKALAGDQ
jgi:hypothetical protein